MRGWLLLVSLLFVVLFLCGIVVVVALYLDIMSADASPPVVEDDSEDDSEVDLEDADEERMAELQAQLINLGYVGATEDHGPNALKRGVVRHNAAKTNGSLAVYTPCGWGPEYVKAGFGAPLREARLIDMTGKILHRWKQPSGNKNSRGWANSKVGPDGSLYAIHANSGLIKLDWNSKVLWRRSEYYHHDLALDHDGTIVALIYKDRTIDHAGKRVTILDCGLVFITPSGRLKRTLWLYPAVAEMPLVTTALDSYFAMIRRLERQAETPENQRRLKNLRAAFRRVSRLGLRNTTSGLDLLHVNTVEILPADPLGRWTEGDILTSFRNLDIVAIVDHVSGEICWHWGSGELYHQHDPSFLPNGNILIFDNGRRSRGSRVVEVEIKTGAIVWSYSGTSEEPFFSDMRGEAQYLSNGNVLIVESQSSRAFEVTRQGEIVWEFYGHDLRDSYRVPLRMTRLEGSVLDSVLAKLSALPSGL